MAAINHKRLLVSLDSFLDTRLGTIAKYDLDAMNKLLFSGKYHTRDCDEFEVIDKDLYRALYKDRNVETLKKSVLTNMFSMLKQVLNTLELDGKRTPIPSKVSIDVNYYPYKLSENELKVMAASIANHLNDDSIDVRMITASPEEMTVEFCKSRYNVMVMYDYEEWLNLIGKQFDDMVMPEVYLFVPSIFVQDRPSDEKIKEITKESMHPMEALEFLAKPLVNLQLVDVKYFSIISDFDDSINP